MYLIFYCYRFIYIGFSPNLLIIKIIFKHFDSIVAELYYPMFPMAALIENKYSMAVLDYAENVNRLSYYQCPK